MSLAGWCEFAWRRWIETQLRPRRVADSCYRLMFARHRRITRRPGLAVDGCDSLLTRVLRNRNIADPATEDYALERLANPASLKDGARAVELLVAAQQSRILILGDYDADGATAIALGQLVLRAMGFGTVSYLVPNRFEYGYGLSPEIAAVALRKKPDLIITVDNGISSIEGAQCIREAGVTLIITDHHLPGAELPVADAIINPNQPGCDFPDKTLAGVGIMFYLLLLLRQKLRQDGWFAEAGRAEPNLGHYLDLVALGTIADMVPLDYNNRIMVARGLRQIRRGRCRPGILALLQVAGKNYQNTVAEDIAFAVAPRLNAAGRLDDIALGIECLLADDAPTARQRATHLDQINAERRQIEQTMRQQALQIVQQINHRAGADKAAWCLYQPHWHQGIIGLVAASVQQQTGRPAAVFAQNGSGLLTGSCRSVTGFHIRDALERIATAQPHLMHKFGGHAMAAGLTLAEPHLKPFGVAFNALATAHFKQHGEADVLWSDGELAADEASLDNAEALRYGAPWGAGFAPPTFDGCFEVIDSRVVGDRHLKLKLVYPDGDEAYDAIAFGALDMATVAPEPQQIQALYRLDVNEFMGNRQVQLILEYFEVMR